MKRKKEKERKRERKFIEKEKKIKKKMVKLLKEHEHRTRCYIKFNRTCLTYPIAKNKKEFNVLYMKIMYAVINRKTL